MMQIREIKQILGFHRNNGNRYRQMRAALGRKIVELGCFTTTHEAWEDLLTWLVEQTNWLPDGPKELWTENGTAGRNYRRAVKNLCIDKAKKLRENGTSLGSAWGG
jgi:hypothetical protein